MKHLLALFIFISSGFVFSQGVPQLINYQAVARSGDGSVLANQNIDVTIKVLSGSATGNTEYEEDHTVTTNDLGLFYFKIGSGTVITGNMTNINWLGDAHFFVVSIDGVDVSTEEIVSIPYSFASRNTEAINGTAVSNVAPANGEVLVYNSTSGLWEPAGIPGQTNTCLLYTSDAADD